MIHSHTNSERSVCMKWLFGLVTIMVCLGLAVSVTGCGGDDDDDGDDTTAVESTDDDGAAEGEAGDDAADDGVESETLADGAVMLPSGVATMVIEVDAPGDGAITASVNWGGPDELTSYLKKAGEPATYGSDSGGSPLTSVADTSAGQAWRLYIANMSGVDFGVSYSIVFVAD